MNTILTHLIFEDAGVEDYSEVHLQILRFEETYGTQAKTNVMDVLTRKTAFFGKLEKQSLTAPRLLVAKLFRDHKGKKLLSPRISFF